MAVNKKLVVISSLVVLVVISIAASRPPKPTYKNLKVLPKNTTHEELDKIMDEFKAALGVKCNFCHAPQKDNPRKVDYASDDKAEKNIARDMMRMTGRINKKFFKYTKSAENPVAPVNCNTCHHGEAHPEAKEGKKEEKKEGGN